jgi:hypothetical protein
VVVEGKHRRRARPARDGWIVERVVEQVVKMDHIRLPLGDKLAKVIRYPPSRSLMTMLIPRPEMDTHAQHAVCFDPFLGSCGYVTARTTGEECDSPLVGAYLPTCQIRGVFAGDHCGIERERASR